MKTVVYFVLALLAAFTLWALESANFQSGDIREARLSIVKTGSGELIASIRNPSSGPISISADIVYTEIMEAGAWGRPPVEGFACGFRGISRTIVVASGQEIGFRLPGFSSRGVKGGQIARVHVNAWCLFSHGTIASEAFVAHDESG